MPDTIPSTDHLPLLRHVTVAADRLLQGWAEGDEGRRRDLWRGLSAATEAAADAVYPLPAEEPHAQGCTMGEFAIDCDPALEGCPCWCHRV